MYWCLYAYSSMRTTHINLAESHNYDLSTAISHTSES